MTGLLLICAAIELSGVTGNGLRARAFFDANNVKVGDPMMLTVDFLGEADFKDLHPPALAKHVDRRDWKLDDVSAKTDTYRDARRLTYRVRPMREGVLWFPSLEFAYLGPDGSRRTVKSNEIPVHAKVGAQVVVAGMKEDANALPEPPALIGDPAQFPPAPETLSDDALFAWRKACAKPTADAFAAFDSAAARMNEATCAIREGNWARALKVYARLEWRIGQTPDIERGILAALALRYDSPAVELPVWRQVGRPLLKYDWKGRLGLVAGALAALALLFWLFGRLLRLLACVAVAVALALPASGQGLFGGQNSFLEEVEKMHQRMQQEMQQQMQQMQQMTSGSGFRFSFGGLERQEPVKITATLETSTNVLQVGTGFSFILSLESPRGVSLENIRLSPSQMFGMTVTGELENLTSVKSANPTNVIRRMSIPVRYDVPYRGPISFTVNGMASGRQGGGRRGGFSFTFSNSFSCQSQPIEINIRPLPTDNQPVGYGGVVSEGLRLQEILDMTQVETNDVIQITYRLFSRGYVPADFLPPGAVFETGRNDQEGLVEYRRFFVADGTNATPRISVPYYDPARRTYRRAETGGTHVTYR